MTVTTCGAKRQSHASPPFVLAAVLVIAVTVTGSLLLLDDDSAAGCVLSVVESKLEDTSAVAAVCSEWRLEIVPVPRLLVLMGVTSFVLVASILLELMEFLVAASRSPMTLLA